MIKKLMYRIDLMVNVMAYAPKGCICHVSASDGYHGTTHSTDCINYTKAWNIYIDYLFKTTENKCRSCGEHDCICPSTEKEPMNEHDPRL